MTLEETWVWLQGALGPASRKALRLVEALGGVSVIYEAGPAALAETGILTRREVEALSDKSTVRTQKIIADCAERGYRVMTPDDADYPARLREIDAPPCALYVWGELPDADAHAYVAVVGTRQITEYGYKAATQLSMGLAQGGAVVVSGLAVGVDGASHRGALKGGGKTVAVTGCGLDIDYPAPHTELRRLIAKNGAIVSEYPPGTRGNPAYFPLRNRIIAGLSLGTVVVEAGSRSGSLITAALAAEMGRDVFAVPGSIFSDLSQGANRLIRDGAKPACSALDILEEYIGFYPHTITLNLPAQSEEATGEESAAKRESAAARVPSEPKAPPRRAAPQGLTATQQRVFETLNDQPQAVDALALSLNLELRVLLAVMTTLEIQGLARPLPGRRYVRAY